MQDRIFSFLDLDTSQRHNQRFAGVLKAGVQQGYFPRLSSAGTRRVDITRGNSNESLLLTHEGVLIKETGDLTGAIQVDFSTITLERIDLCVCEYQYSSSTTTEAIYKVIKGMPAVSDPQPPEPQNIYQIPLFYINIRRGASSIVQTDLKPVIAANTIVSSDLGALKPSIDPSNESRLYVHPGTFPNKSGDTLLYFLGDYSEEITTLSIADGETKYFIFGISDDLEVGIISSSSAPNTVAGYGTDSMPLCIAKAVRTGLSILIHSLIDIRTSFTRRLVPQFEEDSYTDVLGTSIFKYIRMDMFQDTSLIDLSTISTPDVTAEVSKIDTSLTMTKNITGTLSADVTIVTEDILNGLGLSTIYYFMVLADTPHSSITFDYSTVSKYGGFTGTQYSFDSILRIAQGTSSLYLKFNVPYGLLNSAPVKIYSYCSFIDMDYENLNNNSINFAGLIEVVRSQENLITNPFVYWSRLDNDGSSGEPFTTKELVYTLTNDQADINSGQGCYGPDAWQLVKTDNPSANVMLWKRVYKSGSLIPGMELLAQSVVSTVGEYVIEHRVLLGGLVDSRYVTLSLDFEVSQALTFKVALKFYKIVGGELVMQGLAKEYSSPHTSGTAVVISDIQAGSETVAVGIVVTYYGAAITNNSYLRLFNPKLVLGRQTNVQTNPSVQAERVLPYYQRGRALITTREIEGSDLGISLPLINKVVILGEQRSSLIDEGNNIHVSNVSIEQEVRSITLTAVTTRSGSSRLDVQWESFIHYKAIEE